MQVRRGNGQFLAAEDPTSGTLVGAPNGNPFVQLR